MGRPVFIYEARRAESGDGVLEKGSASKEVWGSTVSSPSGVRGRVPAAKRFPALSVLRMTFSNTSVMLSVLLSLRPKWPSEYGVLGERAASPLPTS